MRALWTAATGMKSQQFNIDTIAITFPITPHLTRPKGQNLRIYSTTLSRTDIVDQEGRPVNLQVDMG